MNRLIVNGIAFAVVSVIVWGLMRLTTGPSTAAAANLTHVPGLPTFDQADRGGRALMVAFARYSIDYGEAPGDLNTLVLATPDLCAIDPVVKPALFPDEFDPARARAMEPEQLAMIISAHTPFDYFGYEVASDDGAHAKIIVLAGRTFVTNDRSESEQVDVKFVGYADGRTEWVKRADWPRAWMASQAARNAAGLHPVPDP